MPAAGDQGGQDRLAHVGQRGRAVQDDQRGERAGGHSLISNADVQRDGGNTDGQGAQRARRCAWRSAASGGAAARSRGSRRFGTHHRRLLCSATVQSAAAVKANARRASTACGLTPRMRSIRRLGRVVSADTSRPRSDQVSKKSFDSGAQLLARGPANALQACRSAPGHHVPCQLAPTRTTTRSCLAYGPSQPVPGTASYLCVGALYRFAPTRTNPACGVDLQLICSFRAHGACLRNLWPLIGHGALARAK